MTGKEELNIFSKNIMIRFYTWYTHDRTPPTATAAPATAPTITPVTAPPWLEIKVVKDEKDWSFKISIMGHSNIRIQYWTLNKSKQDEIVQKTEKKVTVTDLEIKEERCKNKQELRQLFQR